MTNDPITFESGHKLEDNGCGDYDLLCPKGGHRFVPVMIGMCVGPKTPCPMCCEPLGENVIFAQGQVDADTKPEVMYVEPCDHVVGLADGRMVTASQKYDGIHRFDYCPKCGDRLAADWRPNIGGFAG